MTRLLPATAVAALLALAACNSQPKAPEVVDANPDPMANTLANRAPIALPPAIKADKTFRCSDNSLIYVTFFDGEKLANVRTSQTGTPTILKADKAGDPYTADGGWTLTGDPSGITVNKAGKGALTCKA
jgi:hypothetical protein